MSGAPVVAIDLGATTVAVCADVAPPPERLAGTGVVEPVDVAGTDDPVEPAAVYAPADGSELRTGAAARRAAAADPSRYEPTPRLRVDETELLLGTRVVGVAEAWGAVLAAARDRAGPLLRGGRPRTLVLTHPADWGRARLEVLRRAGSGLADALVLVPEPVATAALAGWMRPRPRAGDPPRGPFAVLDLGATGAAASVLEAGPEGPRLLAHRADDRFGGDDADELLLAHLLADLPADGAGADGDAARVRAVAAGAGLADRRHRQVLLDDVRAAKEQLSDAEQAPVPIPGRLTAAWLSRDELSEVLRPALRDVVGLLAEAVTAAGTTPDRLDAVWLSGGGARLPLLGALVHRELGVPATVAADPRTVAVRGALVVAREAEARRIVPAGRSRPEAHPGERGPGPAAGAEGWSAVAGDGRSAAPVSGAVSPVSPAAGDGWSAVPVSGDVSPAAADGWATSPLDPWVTAPVGGAGWSASPDDPWATTPTGARRRPFRDDDAADTDELASLRGRVREHDEARAETPSLGPRWPAVRPDRLPARTDPDRRSRRIAVVAAAVALVVAVGGAVLALPDPATPAGPAAPTEPEVTAFGHRFALPAGWITSGTEDTARRTLLRPVDAPRGVDLVAVQADGLDAASADPARARAQLAERFAAARAAGDAVSGLELEDTVAGRPVARYRQDPSPGTRVDWIVLFVGPTQVSVGCRHAPQSGARVLAACERVVGTLDAAP